MLVRTNHEIIYVDASGKRASVAPGTKLDMPQSVLDDLPKASYTVIGGKADAPKEETEANPNDLSTLTKAALVALAEPLGVEKPATLNKADLVAAIGAKRASASTDELV